MNTAQVIFTAVVVAVLPVPACTRPEPRASAVGVYNFVTGVLYLPASLIAGALWSISPSLAFGLSALLSLAAIACFVVLRPVRH